MEGILSRIVNTFGALCLTYTPSSQNFCQQSVYAGLPGRQLELKRLF
jgi:hypothetical protein